MRLLVTSVLTLGLMVIGCGKKDSEEAGGSNGPVSPGGVVNTASESDYRTNASKDLLKLIDRTRSATGSTTTSKTRTSSLALAVAGDFANLPESEDSPINVDSDDCSEIAKLFQVESGSALVSSGGGSSSGSASLYAGEDCGSALKSMKASFQDSLNSVASHVNTLTNFDAEKAAKCTSAKVAKETIPGVALAYRVTAVKGVKAGESASVLVSGSANDKEVSYGFNAAIVSSKFLGGDTSDMGTDDSAGFLPAAPTNSSQGQIKSARTAIDADLTAVGNLEKQSLTLKQSGKVASSLTRDDGKAMTMSFDLSMDAAAEGLKADELLSVTETARVAFTSTVDGRSGVVSGDVSIKLAQVDAATLTVTSSYSFKATGEASSSTAGSPTSISTSYTVTLKRDADGQCRVESVDSGNGGPSAGPKSKTTKK